jgi:pimeloyl-ACP methyl ester carboxylesterase
MTDPRPDLRWTTRPEDAEAVVLVLHGGAAKGLRANQWWHLPVLPLLPVANAIARAGRGRLAVARLRFAVRGWNGAGDSAVADARWGLEQVRAAYPGLPIGVVGHSMGGRVTLRVAADPGVRAIVGLASWVEWADRAHGAPGLSALLLHGDRDRITPPKGSRHMARELTRLGVDAEYVEIPGEGHAFLRHPSEVDRRAADWLVERLVDADDGAEPEVRPDAAPERGRTS